jgi:hypothetical protein
MEKFDLEALMAEIDTASANVFNVVLQTNLDALEITEEEFKTMLDQAKSIYESEEGMEINLLCTRLEGNTFLYAFCKDA